MKKCGTVSCSEAASARVYWPGETIDMCPGCAKRAQNSLSVAPLVTLDDVRRLADEAREEIRRYATELEEIRSTCARALAELRRRFPTVDLSDPRAEP